MTTFARFLKFAALNSVFMAIIVSANAQTAPTDGLVAFYPFNGNANDASGNGFNGVVHGVIPIADRAGLQNSAYRFNGGWIQLPDEVSAVSPAELTISLWVLADHAPYTTQQTLIELSPRTGECGFAITPGDPGDWNFAAHLQTSDWKGGGEPLAANLWSHLVGTFKKGQSLQFWVDGVLRMNTALPDENLYLVPNFPLNTTIGVYDFGGSLSQLFFGAIDDVRIYNRALSAAEIQELYAAEAKIVPTVSLIKAIKPSFSNLLLGTNYQLQLSGDLSKWTDQGSPFTATSRTMIYPQYWDVENWSSLYFRLQITK